MDNPNSAYSEIFRKESGSSTRSAGTTKTVSIKSNIHIYLIRHGQAAAAWDEDPDPSLSDLGQQQAEHLANQIVPTLKGKNFQILTSPLLRAQRTALPTQQQLGIEATVNQNFAEIPSPSVSLKGRKAWLSKLFSQPLTSFEAPQTTWRNNILSAVQSLPQNTLIFSHFMTINAITGWIDNCPNIVHFHPNYCSVTKIERIGQQFFIREMGEEMTTLVR